MWFHETSLFFAIYPQTNLFKNIYLRLSLDPLKLMGILLLTLMGTWWGLIYCVQEVSPSWRQSRKSEKGYEELMQLNFAQSPTKNLLVLLSFFCPTIIFSFHSSFFILFLFCCSISLCHYYHLVVMEFSFPTLWVSKT